MSTQRKLVTSLRQELDHQTQLTLEYKQKLDYNEHMQPQEEHQRQLKLQAHYTTQLAHQQYEQT